VGERGEQRDEQLAALDGRPGQGERRRADSGRIDRLGQLIRALGDVEADADDDRAGYRLGQDPAALAVPVGRADQQVVRAT
jgi:hypothetical protein